MLNISKEFLNAMGSYPYIARITIDGIDVIQGDAVQEIYFRCGANSSEDIVMLGSAFAGSVEIALDQPSVSCAIEGRELFVELGLNLESGIEWIPMGKYTAENPTSADGVLTVKGIDALGAKFDVDFEPLEGFDFSVGGGVSSVAFLEALCARRGVAANVAGLGDVSLKVSPEGFTERQIIGFISALYGGFANIDRTGVLKIRCYTEVEAQVSADTYYEDGLEKATYSFAPGWLKCHNEAADLTLFVGDFDAQQGIKLESIWMNQAILNGLWEKLQGFIYRPVPELSFLGNPLLDPGDILTLEDSAGEKVKVPVMTMSHEYDGGIITSIAAYGQAKTTEYQSPTRRAVIRSTESAKQFAADENAKLDQLELLKRLTKEWVDDGIYLTKEGKLGVKASAMVAGLLSSVDGKTFVLDLDNGTLKMNATELSVAGKPVAEIANDSVKELNKELNQHEIFNRLTGGGEAQGLFMKDGQLYINASYLAAGIITSVDGSVQIDLSKNTVKVYTADRQSWMEMSGGDIKCYEIDSAGNNVRSLWIDPRARGATWIVNDGSTGGIVLAANKGPTMIGSGATETRVDGSSVRIGNKTVSWRDNGDGTSTLIGQ